MDYAVVDGDGNVVNTIVYSEGSNWAPPEGCTVEAVTDDTGPAYNGGRFANGRFLPKVNRSHPRADDDPVQLARPVEE